MTNNSSLHQTKKLLSSKVVQLSVGFAALLILLVGAAAALRLASSNQDNRDQAQTVDDSNPCEWCGSTCKLKTTAQMCDNGLPLTGYNCQYVSKGEQTGCQPVPKDPTDPKLCEWCGRDCVRTGSEKDCRDIMPPSNMKCEFSTKINDCDEVSIVPPTATPGSSDTKPTPTPTKPASITGAPTNTPKPTATPTATPTVTPKPSTAPTNTPKPTVTPAPTSTSCQPKCEYYPACYYANPGCNLIGQPTPVGGWCLPADFDRDHDVDSADIGYLVDRFFSTSSSTAVQQADLNRDGSVDLRDYNELVDQWTGSKNINICK